MNRTQGTPARFRAFRLASGRLLRMDKDPGGSAEVVAPISIRPAILHQHAPLTIQSGEAFRRDGFAAASDGQMQGQQDQSRHSTLRRSTAGEEYGVGKSSPRG